MAERVAHGDGGAADQGERETDPEDSLWSLSKDEPTAEPNENGRIVAEECRVRGGGPEYSAVEERQVEREEATGQRCEPDRSPVQRCPAATPETDRSS